MRGVENTHVSVSIGLVLKSAVLFPRRSLSFQLSQNQGKRLDPFPLLSLWVPLVLVDDWHVNLLFLSNESGRMGT